MFCRKQIDEKDQYGIGIKNADKTWLAAAISFGCADVYRSVLFGVHFEDIIMGLARPCDAQSFSKFCKNHHDMAKSLHTLHNRDILDTSEYASVSNDWRHMPHGSWKEASLSSRR